MLIREDEKEVITARRTLLILLLVSLIALGMASCGGGGSGDTQKAAPPTQEDVVAFVNEALDYARNNPKEEVLAEFTDQDGKFVRGELYIYAYDYSCTVLAHGGNPSLVGQNLYNMEDANGVRVIRELAKLAEGGGGWLSYMWDNPVTGKNEPKLGYVVPVDNTWFLGSGTYPEN
jgi:polar amino acid transport system substrate-binding protein